ncbi:hypothetical protein J6590_071183 [Homalodisca vitripennis]|nr:hypothetical protein J6590_071183 [Homalodisca vitripennis]
MVGCTPCRIVKFLTEQVATVVTRIPKPPNNNIEDPEEEIFSRGRLHGRTTTYYVSKNCD